MDGIWRWDAATKQLEQAPDDVELGYVIRRFVAGDLIWRPDLLTINPLRRPQHGRNDVRTGGWSTDAAWRAASDNAAAEAARRANRQRLIAPRQPRAREVPQEPPQGAHIVERRVPVSSAAPTKPTTDARREARRAASVAAIRERCQKEGWTFEARAGCLGSYGGAVVVVEGKLVVVEPTARAQTRRPARSLSSRPDT